MTHIVLFHSVYGLRPAVNDAADRFRAAGHTVTVPDLYDGQVADTAEDGFALRNRIGGDAVDERAREALRTIDAGAVLAGFSMGGWVAGTLVVERPHAAGLLLLSGPCPTEAARTGLRVQAHVADPDEFDSPEDIASWREEMIAGGAEVEMYTYPGVGHLYTDPSLADYDAAAADLTWQRCLAFLTSL